MRHIEIKFFDSMEWALYNKKWEPYNPIFLLYFLNFKHVELSILNLKHSQHG